MILMPGHKRWTPAEEQFVRECAHAKIPTSAIAGLLDRSDHSVRMRRHALGLPPPRGPMFHMTSGRGGASVSEIKRIVAHHFGVPVESMESPERSRKVARPRQVAMFFAREVARKSYPLIGQMFARDHTTALHAVHQVERLMGEDHKFKDELTTIRRNLCSLSSPPVVDKPASILDEPISAGA